MRVGAWALIECSTDNNTLARTTSASYIMHTVVSCMQNPVAPLEKLNNKSEQFTRLHEQRM